MPEHPELLTRAVETILPTPSAYAHALAEAEAAGRKLRGYLGVDPTSPHLHIGHSVAMRNLARFQQAGHQAILLIGDFTGRLGDPDKLATRVPLTKEQIAENMRTYLDQVRHILEFAGPNPVEIRYNSSWSDALTFEEVIKLAANFTVQQMLERDMFQRRLREQRPISLSEFFYPLMQGYDAVALEADVQFGGTDQTFNMLAGRTLNRILRGTEMFVVANPLLADSNGVKIGKTMGNAINIDNPPQELYGQMMSLPDDVIIPGFRLLTGVPESKIDQLEQRIINGENPMAFKKQLAYTIVAQFASDAEATAAQQHFEATVQGQEVPTDLETVILTPGMWNLDALVVASGAADALSNSERRRLWDQKGIEVKVHDQSLFDRTLNLDTTVDSVAEAVIRVGKRRFKRVTFGA